MECGSGYFQAETQARPRPWKERQWDVQPTETRSVNEPEKARRVKEGETGDADRLYHGRQALQALVIIINFMLNAINGHREREVINCSPWRYTYICNLILRIYLGGFSKWFLNTYLTIGFSLISGKYFFKFIHLRHPWSSRTGRLVHNILTYENINKTLENQYVHQFNNQ